VRVGTSIYFGDQLEEDLGRLDIHPYIVSWRHDHPLYYMYSRFAPFCMRIAIVMKKIRSEVFVVISCVVDLSS
jgi:hypothetical protein